VRKRVTTGGRFQFEAEASEGREGLRAAIGEGASVTKIAQRAVHQEEDGGERDE
jgi:hypothetical protein